MAAGAPVIRCVFQENSRKDSVGKCLPPARTLNEEGHYGERVPPFSPVLPLLTSTRTDALTRGRVWGCLIFR